MLYIANYILTLCPFSLCLWCIFVLFKTFLLRHMYIQSVKVLKIQLEIQKKCSLKIKLETIPRPPIKTQNVLSISRVSLTPSPGQYPTPKVTNIVISKTAFQNGSCIMPLSYLNLSGGSPLHLNNN